MLKNRFIVFCVAFLCWVSVFAQDDARDQIALIVNYSHETCSPMHDRDLRFGENLAGCICNMNYEEEQAVQAQIHHDWVAILKKRCLFNVVNRENTDEISRLLAESSKKADAYFKKNFGDDGTGNLRDKEYHKKHEEKIKNLDKKQVREWKEIKEKSKGYGAKWIFLIDATDSREGDKWIRNYRVKMIQVETNLMIVFTIRPKNQFSYATSSSEEFVELINRHYREQKKLAILKIDETFNTNWIILDVIKKKEIRAGATSNTPGGEGLKVYWYTQATDIVGGFEYYYTNYLGPSKLIESSKDEPGSIFRTEQKFNESDITINGQYIPWGKLIPLDVRGYIWPNYTQLMASFVEMKKANKLSSFEIHKINSLVYDAFYESDMFLLTEVTDEDHEIYRELNLQKDEEYIEGSTVSQTGAVNAGEGFYITDLGSDKKRVKIELKYIDKVTGEIKKIYHIDEKYSDFKDKVIECLTSVALPCKVRKIKKNEIHLFTNVKYNMFKKFKYILFSYESMNVAGEETSIRIPLAHLKFIETYGQKSRFKVSEVLDKKNFKKIKESDELYIGADFN